MAWLGNKKLNTEQKIIRDDLISQLEAKGQNTSYYRDLVNDYIIMLKTRDKLQKDIEERGTLLEYNNGGGQTGWKKNDSVEQFNKICDRMVKHLDFLGIKPSETVSEDDDDEL
nr:MAG TPA: terminase small subunit [Caudoviricetes sp.]